MSIRTLLIAACLSASLGLPVTAAAQPYALDAREDTTFGGRPGTLRVGDAGVVFEARDPKNSRRWSLDEVRQLRIESSRRLVIETYHSRGWRDAGRSRTYEYETTAAIPRELVAFLVSRVTMPLVTAVLPPRPVAASVTVAVHHEGTDTAGALALYDDGLAFETARDGYARFWRFADLDAVLRQDTFRLYIAAYEGSREHIRPFLFTLKQDLPPAFSAALWQHLNRRPASPAQGASR